MNNQYLTDTYQYLHNHSLFSWSFTNAKLVPIDSLNQINIYIYNSHIQDETLYNGRMLKELCCYSLFLVLILKFLTNMVILIQFIIQIKWFCQFPWRYNLNLIQIWIEWYMDGCPFRFAFKYAFNLPAKVLAYSNEK